AKITSFGTATTARLRAPEPRCRLRGDPRFGVMTARHGSPRLSGYRVAEDGYLLLPLLGGGVPARAVKGDARPRRLDGTGPLWWALHGLPVRTFPELCAHTASRFPPRCPAAGPLT